MNGHYFVPKLCAYLLLFVALADRAFAQAPSGPVAAPPAFIPPAAATTNPTAPAATSVLPPTSSLVASIPFQYVYNKVAIGLLIDGQGPFNIGIDSGSETMVVSQQVASEANLATKTGTIEVSGTSGGYLPVAQAAIGQLKIGQATVDRPVCTVATTPLPVDGYLGAPLLNKYVVEIDPGSMMVRLFDPAKFTPDPNDVAVPLEFGKHRVPVISGTIGGLSGSFEIDTGSAFAAELVPAFVTAQNLTQKFTKVASVGMMSDHGLTTSDVYSMNDLTLGADGSIGLKGEIATIYLNPDVPAPDSWDGRIGAPLLRQFVVTFDYAQSKIYFRPITAAAPPSPAPALPPAAPNSSTPPASP